MPRRERWSILADILRVTRELNESDPARAKITTLATRSGLPHDRLQRYLEELASAGLVTRDRMPQLTDRGRAVLAHYDALRDVMDRFGLE